jgi:hypothetical protein
MRIHQPGARPHVGPSDVNEDEALLLFDDPERILKLIEALKTDDTVWIIRRSPREALVFIRRGKSQ